MFLHITNARYLEDYKVEVSFNNGRKGIADLADALKGTMFEPLKNKSVFSRLIVDKVWIPLFGQIALTWHPSIFIFKHLKKNQNYSRNLNNGTI